MKIFEKGFNLLITIVGLIIFSSNVQALPEPDCVDYSCKANFLERKEERRHYQLLKDVKSGCSVWSQDNKNNETIKWSGDCVGGKASGEGILKWYINDVEYMKYDVSKRHSLIMRDGYFKALINPANIELKMKETKGKCIEKRGFGKKRVIIANVSENVNLSSTTVVLEILNIAGRFADKECYVKPSMYNTLETYIYRKKQPSDNLKMALVKGVRTQAVRDPRNTSWLIKINSEFDKIYSIANENYSNELERIKNERLRIKKEKVRQQKVALQKKAAEKKAQAQRLFEHFEKKYNVQAWPSLDELSVNPFAYEGKTVGLVVLFSKMITATEGIFGNDIIVNGIPTGLFKKSIKVVLAGKVLGNKAIKTAFGGEMLLPYLKYKGMYSCKEWDCSDILDK